MCVRPSWRPSAGGGNGSIWSGALKDVPPPKAGVRSELLPEWLAWLSPSAVSGCLGRADADEPVRLVLKVKPFGPGLAPHVLVYLSRCGKRETYPLHCLHQRGRKSPTQCTVQQLTSW